jgi:hypothetical protein
MSPSTNNWRWAHVLLMMFGLSLPPVVCRRAHVLLMMFGLSLPPVVCRRAHVLLMMLGLSLPPLLQTTGGKDKPNIINKT